jgi:hypothetical protein
MQCQPLALAGPPGARLLLDPGAYGFVGCTCTPPSEQQADVRGGATVALRCMPPAKVSAVD